MTQKGSSFESMPLELHFNLLRHMSAPEDVLATIQASPAALSAFQTGRERVYRDVLETSLAPEIFREFLAIVNAPDHNKCPTVSPPNPAEEGVAARNSILREWQMWEKDVIDFLRSHRGAVYSLPSPKTNPSNFKAQIKFIVRLYFCLSKFVNFYPAFVESQVTGTRLVFPHAAQSKHERPRLTDIELLRLQRGLLRYELCCRLVGIPWLAAHGNSQFFFGAFGFQTRAERWNRNDLWRGNIFIRLLPVDEVEEVVCARTYVHSLSNSLRCSFVEELEKAILDLSQSLEERSAENDGNGSRKNTVRGWISNSRSEEYYLLSKWYDGGLGSQLGLAFLDRVTRSNATDRREFIRCDFHTFGSLVRESPVHSDNFLRTSWHDIVSRWELPWTNTMALEVGPHCNPILQTSITHDATSRLLATHGADDLRRLGWVFFDDQSKLRSLGLPHDGKASSIHNWVTKKSRVGPLPSFATKLSTSALAARLTEDEWKELLTNFSPKDLNEDFRVMARFVVGAKAVVDFTSDRLPQMT